MKLFISLLISFHIISLPVLAEVGEKETFSIKKQLHQTMAASEAKDFEATTRELLAETSAKGVQALTKELKAEDQAAVESLIKNVSLKPKFTEKAPGVWEYKSQGHLISFSLKDLHQGQMKINGKIFNYRDVPMSELQGAAEKALALKKISMVEMIFNNSFGIQNAEACELVCAAVLLVVAVAIIGTAVYELMIKPKKMVKRLQEMKMKLDQDAKTCQEAKSDSTQYDKTFALASHIADRSALTSTSSTDALEYAIQKQLSSGQRKNEDCYQIMNEIGKKVKINIPVPSQKQIERREILGTGNMNEEVDVANAAFNLCSSYNQLGSCMEGFVAAHVNDSDINTFKESATPSHWKYQKKAGSGAQ
jgi:hypothetical protein